jgi:hypothetical protein
MVHVRRSGPILEGKHCLLCRARAQKLFRSRKMGYTTTSMQYLGTERDPRFKSKQQDSPRSGLPLFQPARAMCQIACGFRNLRRTRLNSPGCSSVGKVRRCLFGPQLRAGNCYGRVLKLGLSCTKLTTAGGACGSKSTHDEDIRRRQSNGDILRPYALVPALSIREFVIQDQWQPAPRRSTRAMRCCPG